MPSGASLDAIAANAAAQNMKAASCLTHLMAYFGGAAPAGCCEPRLSEEDEVAVRMRRSMSSRGQDVSEDGPHAHGGLQPQAQQGVR